MGRHRSRVVSVWATVVLGVVSGCGDSGSTAPATAAPDTTIESTTTEESTTTTEAPTTTEEPTTTTTSPADAVLEWAITTHFDEKWAAVSTALRTLFDATSVDNIQIDAVKDACQAVHDANEAVAASLPAPEPRLDAALAAMVEDWDTGMQLCVDALASGDMDAFGKVPEMINQAFAHIDEVNAALADLGYGSEPDTAGTERVNALATEIGCTEVTVAPTVEFALASAYCTYRGAPIVISAYDGAPPMGATSAYCDGNEGKPLSMAVGPDWIMVVGDEAEALMATLVANYKDEFSMTMMFC